MALRNAAQSAVLAVAQPKALHRAPNSVGTAFNENFRKGKISKANAALIYQFLKTYYPDSMSSLNAAVTTEIFLITKSFWALPAALVIHGVGYLACLREPRVFDLWITKVSRCPRVRNWQRWGCNSYTA